MRKTVIGTLLVMALLTAGCTTLSDTTNGGGLPPSGVQQKTTIFEFSLSGPQTIEVNETAEVTVHVTPADHTNLTRLENVTVDIRADESLYIEENLSYNLGRLQPRETKDLTFTVRGRSSSTPNIIVTGTAVPVIDQKPWSRPAERTDAFEIQVGSGGPTGTRAGGTQVR